MSELDFFKPPKYNAYLIRLWQENAQTPWRASAQCASTGEKFYFATLEALFAFLQAQTTPIENNTKKNDIGKVLHTPHENTLPN